MVVPKARHPYQNLSLKSIKGEKWKDIPGLDGYFQLSNFGRIKRLHYEMQYKDGRIYQKPEKIIKPMVISQQNKFKKDYTYFLSARVTLSGKRYNITIARMVYHLFVEVFDLDDHNIVILCIDTDNFNIRPSNLQKAGLNQKQQRTVDRDRFRSPLLDLSEGDLRNQRNAIVKSVSKQVTQYNSEGKRLKTFPSIAAAEKATGVFATSIRKVASGNSLRAGGYVWRFGKEPRVDVLAQKRGRRKAYIKKYGQKVSQYDFTGKKIAQYPSVKDASDASGAHVNAIHKVLNGVYKSAKGFFWKKGYGKDFIDLSHYKWGRVSMAATQSKPVKQYSLEGKYVQTFPSLKKAAASVGVSSATLSGALNGRQHTCGGYKWKCLD